jgi:hypothetical protein
MQQVILDESIRSKLGNLVELLELRDENGRLLGHCVPAGISDVADGATCPLDDDEIEQLRRQTGGRSLAEIWQDLGRT